jgi:hypothetical protein
MVHPLHTYIHLNPENGSDSETSGDIHRTALFYSPITHGLVVLENRVSKIILGVNGNYNEALIENSTMMMMKSSYSLIGCKKPYISERVQC